MERFELTEKHIKLLNRMYVEWDEGGYYGSPAINAKRPYGNSFVPGDVYEILNGKDVDEMSDDESEDLLKIHAETATALQIVLCTKSFEPGLYEKEFEFKSRSWRKIA